MTEAEWLACEDDPAKMLEFLRDKASERKLRLFACECCHHISSYIRHERWGDYTSKSITSSERYAEGLVSHDEWQHARENADRLRDRIEGHRRYDEEFGGYFPLDGPSLGAYAAYGTMNTPAIEAAKTVVEHVIR